LLYIRSFLHFFVCSKDELGGTHSDGFVKQSPFLYKADGGMLDPPEKKSGGMKSKTKRVKNGREMRSPARNPKSYDRAYSGTYRCVMEERIGTKDK